MTILSRHPFDDRPGGAAFSAGDRVAFQILVFLAATLLLAHLVYLSGLGLSAFIPAAAFAIACFSGFTRYGVPDSGNRVSRLATLLAFPVVLFFSLAVATFFYDVSFDGQVYHQDAILRLVHGWNPLLETGPAWHEKIPEHYPKAAWIIAASLQSATGSIESGKALNFLLVIASFFIARRALAATGLISIRGMTLVATLLALNPVSVCQLFSFMVDGCLASLLVILLGLMIILAHDPSRTNTFQLGITAVLLGNVKYTGLVFLAVLGVPWLLLFLWTRRALAKSALLSAGAIVFLTVFLFGYNPYVVNMMHHGDPLYPLLSEEGKDFEGGQVNADFYRKNRIEKFALSVVAQSRNSLHEPPVLKVPFHVSACEALTFTTWDTRFAGWGPLFSGALAISILMMAILWRRCPDAFRAGMVMIVWLLVSILVFPEPWWARFVPQVWFLPAVALVLAWPVPVRPMVFLRRTLAATMILNVVFVSLIYLGAETWSSLYLREHLAILSEMSAKEPLSITFQLYPSNGERLKAAGVQFRAVEVLPCERPVFFDRVGRDRSETATLICVDRQDYAQRETTRLVLLRDWRNRFVSDIVPGGKTTDGTPLAVRASK